MTKKSTFEFVILSGAKELYYKVLSRKDASLKIPEVNGYPAKLIGQIRQISFEKNKHLQQFKILFH